MGKLLYRCRRHAISTKGLRLFLRLIVLLFLVPCFRGGFVQIIFFWMLDIKLPANSVCYHYPGAIFLENSHALSWSPRGAYLGSYILNFMHMHVSSLRKVRRWRCLTKFLFLASLIEGVTSDDTADK